MPAAAPPTALTPSCSEVMPPARMQMMENEMAKLEKPLMRRSGWRVRYRKAHGLSRDAVVLAARNRIEKIARLQYCQHIHGLFFTLLACHPVHSVACRGPGADDDTGAPAAGHLAVVDSSR